MRLSSESAPGHTPHIQTHTHSHTHTHTHHTLTHTHSSIPLVRKSKSLELRQQLEAEQNIYYHKTFLLFLFDFFFEL